MSRDNTQRDREIYEAVKRGDDLNQIAEHFGLSVKHIRRIYTQQHTLSWAPDFINAALRRRAAIRETGDE